MVRILTSGTWDNQEVKMLYDTSKFSTTYSFFRCFCYILVKFAADDYQNISVKIQKISVNTSLTIEFSQKQSSDAAVQNLST